MKPMLPYLKAFSAFLLLLLMAQCQTDETVVKEQGPELFVSHESIDKVMREIRNPVLQQTIQKLTHPEEGTIKRASEEELQYFNKIIKGNEYIVYELLVNDYKSEKPYFEYFVIKQFPDREEAGYVKYTPNGETAGFDIRTFSGKMEMTNLEGGKYGEQSFLNGAAVSATESCTANIAIIVHNCTNGGDHSPEEACAAGYENDGYYEISIYIHCSADHLGPIGAPQTLVSVIGGSAGANLSDLHNAAFVGSLSEEASLWWHDPVNMDLVLSYNQYLEDNQYSPASRNNLVKMIWSMIHNDGYSGDGPTDDGDSAETESGPKMSIPQTLILNDGSTVAVSFGTTASDNESADNEVDVKIVDALKFALEQANSNLNTPNKIHSIHISATTNGSHNPNSNHYRGTAIDISKINNKKVVTLHQNAQVQELQEAFDDYSNIRENFGPVFRHKTATDGSRDFNANVAPHEDHIHISVR